MATIARTPAATDQIVCPRCGHDLRGDRLAWRDSCPLQGRCSECAVTFAWGDLLSGRLNYPAWSTEGARGILAWTGRTGRQLLVTTLRPRRCLRQLRLEHRIRPVRLAAGLVLPLLLLAGVLVLITARGYVAFGVPWSRAVAAVLSSPPDARVSIAFPTPQAGERLVAIQVGNRFTFVERDPGWGPIPMIDEDPPAGQGYQLLPHPRIEVRSADGGVVLIPAGGDGMMRGVPGGPQEMVWFYPQAMIQAARQCNGVTMTYPSPVRSLLDRLEDHAGLVGGFVLPLVLVVPISVGGFIVLPLARRRARVRWAHLLRLTVLAAHGSLGLLVVLLGLGPLTEVIGPGRPAAVDLIVAAVGDLIGLARVDRPLVPGIGGFFVLPILLGATWWTWAAWHYLRMERSVLVGASVATVSWLTFVVGAGALLFFLGPG